MKKVIGYCISILVLTVWLFSFQSCKKDDPQPVLPIISSLSNNSGGAGTPVIIKGSNFSPEITGNTVKFNGKMAVVTSASETQITTTVPADAGTGKVTVETIEGIAEGPVFTYFVKPEISSINPTSAKHSATLTITGNNLNVSGVVVKINGTVATITSTTSTEIKVIVPIGVGTGKVAVETLGGIADGPILNYILTITVSTLAGNSTSGYADGTAAEARFNSPIGIAFDSQDNLYVCDRANHRIRKITPDGLTTTFAGSGVQGTANGEGILAEFSSPRGITRDAQGNFYITNTGKNIINKMTSTATVTTIAGDGGIGGYADGVGTSASFFFPTGIVFDQQGNLIIADLANARLRKLVPTSGVVTTIAGNGGTDFLAGNGIAAQLTPSSIIMDNKSNLYIADGDKYILNMTSTGDVSIFAGNGVVGFADGSNDISSFNIPQGITITKDGDLIVSDTGNHRIRLISKGIVSTIAGDGTAGWVDGDGSIARFNSPAGIAVNSKGQIFICDRLGHTIRKMTME